MYLKVSTLLHINSSSSIATLEERYASSAGFHQIYLLAKLSNLMRHSVNRPPTPDAQDERDKDPNLQDAINIKLIESGEKERLMELLREKLVECGWKDEMKYLCREFIKKKGRNNVSVDDLVHVITPKGRSSIPDSVKAELLQRIRTILVSTTR